MNNQKNKIQVDNKKILVLGGGVSGLAAAAFLQKKGAAVTLADNKTKEQVSGEVLALGDTGVQLHLGGMPEDVAVYDLAVISPGLPLDSPIAEKLQAAAVPIVGELELAYLFSHSPYLAITGTNGKTTTTTLLGYILEQARVDRIVGGNIGTPLVERVEALADDAYIVAEVSSFQLETTTAFHPKAAAYLNLTPDHMNRHYTMENYGNIKAKIFANQGADDVAVLNYDDEKVRAYAEQIKSEVFFFSRKSMPENGIYAKDGAIFITRGGRTEKLIDIDDIFIKGGHNVENVMAASAMAYVIGIDIKVIRESLISFRGVEHRQEYVREKDGVLYINDSKGTNPDSTLQALLAYDRPMVLLLGGYNKKSSFDLLLPLIKEKVHHVVILGETSEIIKEMLDKNGYENYALAGSDFERAVSLAVGFAKPGDVVMLSPACASWDMFKCFEDRGDLFKKLVNNL